MEDVRWVVLLMGSVVDRDYRLIDGSTFLFSPGTNPQATVMMLGRYMGVRILRKKGANLHEYSL